MSNKINKTPLMIVGLIIAIFSGAHFFKLLINTTPSMKLGLYIKANIPISRGETVAFCLPESYRTSGLEQGYLSRGTKCGNTEPLIKKIIAVPGDHVVLADNYIQVNEIRFFYPTKYSDNSHRRLVVYPRGDYIHTKGYWMIGDHAINSWDSRYFGVIPKSNILYPIKPLLVW